MSRPKGEPPNLAPLFVTQLANKTSHLVQPSDQICVLLVHRYWHRLPEVQQKVRQEKRKSEAATNRLRVKLYQKVDKLSYTSILNSYTIYGDEERSMSMQ